MKKFKNLFDDFLKERTDIQISIIDELCENMDIDPEEWFNFFLSDTGDYSSVEFLHELLSDFMFYLSDEIQRELLKFIEPDGYNMYNKPYIQDNINLSSM